MAKTRLVVVGNGMAGLRFLEEVTALAPDRFGITVIGEEAGPAYNRVLLSPLLAGEISAADVCMRPRDWYVQNQIALISGVAARELDPASRTVKLADGGCVDFDVCVLATGSEPIRLKVPGAALNGVEVFRALSDVDRLLRCAGARRRAVVIGGGLLGIEAAYGLKRAGADVTLVHLMDRLMERQLDYTAAALLKEALESKGIEVLLGAATTRIEGRESVERLILNDGRCIPASLIVMAIGIRPRIDLVHKTAIRCHRGISVNDRMQTSVPGIFAIGECADHRGIVYGLVEPAYEQARVAAHAICGRDAVYQGSVLSTNLKVSGVPVFSAGDFDGIGAEHVVLRDEPGGSYRKFVIREGRLAGVVMIGDTADALWYCDLIRSGRDLSPFRASLPFGRAYAEAA
jgi:nitrite reductase (NADH) large subunit